MALMSSLLSWVIRATVLVGLYVVGWIVYNIFFHPLAKFPGPLLWRATWLPYTRGGLGGHFPYDVQKLHQKYGDVVRTGPDELSFAHPNAWDDIYSNTAGANSGAFKKSQLWHGQSQAGPPSVFATIDLKDHARIRRFMDPAFSERAVLKQEPIIQEYVNLSMEKLRERLSKGLVTVNVVDWLNFILFDTIGDLSFGESFGCLENCEPQGWMAQMGMAIRLHYTYINLRHYPILLAVLGPVLMLLMPKSLMQAQEEFRQRSVDKLNRRLATSQSARPDIVSQLLQSENSKEGLTPDEVMLNSMLFINAASETTGTSLTGAINLLVQNPASLSVLEREVRQQFSDKSDLTLTALKQLPYLNAVLKESLRMCNPNPIGHIRIAPPTGGTVAGHYVPGNTLVTVHPQTISYSEENFHDAKSWRPERWLAETDSKSPYYNDKRKAVRAFGWGPQNCVGEPLGWAEMRLILAKMVWTFDLKKANTSNNKIIWEEQEVYGILFKHRLDVTFAERSA